jgi:hypothetical protein
MRRTPLILARSIAPRGALRRVPRIWTVKGASQALKRLSGRILASGHTSEANRRWHTS